MRFCIKTREFRDKTTILTSQPTLKECPTLLPMFKQKRKETGLIIETRKPDEQKEEDAPDAALHAAASDLHAAINSSNIKDIAEALRAAFQILESEPHEEEPADDENDFHSQNIKAAQEME